MVSLFLSTYSSFLLPSVISPFEQCFDGNEKYQELLPIMARDREKLSEGFRPEKTEWLEKYDAVLNEMASMAEVEAFKCGFRLATSLYNELR